MRISRLSLAVAVVALFGSTGASAQVVYDGGAPTGDYGRTMFGGFTVYQGFTLGAPVTASAVRFWGITSLGSGPYLGSMAYGIYTNVGGTATGLVAGATVTGTSTLRGPAQGGAFESYQYDFGIPSLGLGAGSYFLALHANSSSPNFYWEVTTPRPGDPQYQLSGSSRLDNTDDVAFQLRDPRVTATPEPGSLVLAATGLMLVGAVARRRPRRV
jgi:hypothetical protein